MSPGSPAHELVDVPRGTVEIASSPSGARGQSRVGEVAHPPRIRGFDGLRAIAVGLVVLGHTGVQGAVGGPFFAAFNSGTGVQIFFALSGFLITTLLVRERALTGSVDLFGFMARRALRIIPAYAIALGFAFLIGAPLAAIALAATYTYNLATDATQWYALNHFWSLSVEEHFYLVWPLAFLVLGRSARWFVVGIAIACVAATLGGAVGRWTIPAALAICLGCLAALSELRLRSPLFLVAAVPILTLGGIGGAVGATMIVVWVATNQDRIGLIEWRPLVYLGTISYGIYIWQGILTGNGPQHDGVVFPPSSMALAVVLSVMVAIVSFHVVERPIQRWGRRRLVSRRAPTATEWPRSPESPRS